MISEACDAVDGVSRRDPTRAYLASFVALGLIANMLGPSITVLRHQVHVGVGTMAWLFASSSIGYFVGSIAAGRGYDRRLGHGLYVGALIVAIGAFGMIAWTSSFVVLVVAFLVVGIATAAVDVGGNTLLVWQRVDNVGPHMNALHLFFGVGALISPVLVNRSVAANGDLRVAWIAIAIFGGAAAVWIAKSHAPDHGEAETAAREGVALASDKRLLAIVSAFFVLYVGLELGFAGWIHTYAEEIRLGSANTISAVTTLFWVAFTFGRLAAVGVSRRMKPAVLLRYACIVSVVAAALLLVANGRAIGVWPATAVFGFAVAPQFPTMIAFAEEHLTLTGTAAAWFIGAASIGGFASRGSSAVCSAVLARRRCRWSYLARRSQPSRGSSW